MISGVHAIVYSKSAERLREFLQDAFDWPSVDAGRGWLIFATPPAELAVHPGGDGAERHELYLMCEDIEATIDYLKGKGVVVSDISDQPWGLLVQLTLPSGDEIGLYQPKHPLPPRG